MAMKELIKKILKEEINNGYTKLELIILQWIYKKLLGRNLPEEKYYDHQRLLENLKNTFGLSNKELIEMVNLYRDNYTTGGFQQRDDVIRKPLKKYRVNFLYDYSGFQENYYDVWGSDEDDAFIIATASEDTGEFVENFIEGEVVYGDRGEHFDTEIHELTETIKKELNLLKEEITKKLPDKLLIPIFKKINNWLEKHNNSVDDLSNDGYVYGQLIQDVITPMALFSYEEEDYIIASFVENFIPNGDWDSLLGVGLVKPKEKNFTIRKVYGVSGIATDEANGEAFLPSALIYSDLEGGLDWDSVGMDISDMWDVEYEIGD